VQPLESKRIEKKGKGAKKRGRPPDWLEKKRDRKGIRNRKRRKIGGGCVKDCAEQVPTVGPKRPKKKRSGTQRGENRKLLCFHRKEETRER